MARYDYSCSNCGNEREEIHSMVEKPIIKCEICNHIMDKMICGDVYFGGVDGTASMYNFVDHNTTGKPVVINSKTQWRNHLKSRGLTDDIDQGTPKKDSLKLFKSSENKEQKRKVYKESVAQALKETGILQKYGK